MSERKRVRAVLTPGGHRSRVDIDGVEQTNVRGIEIKTRIGEPTTVTLELINVEVEVETGLVETTHLGSENREYAEAPTSDAAARDLDETRRLCYIAKMAIAAGRKLSPDLVGTIVNAIAHHSGLLEPPVAEAFGHHLLNTETSVFTRLEALTEIIVACESS